MDITVPTAKLSVPQQHFPPMIAPQHFTPTTTSQHFTPMPMMYNLFWYNFKSLKMYHIWFIKKCVSNFNCINISIVLSTYIYIWWITINRKQFDEFNKPLSFSGFRYWPKNLRVCHQMFRSICFWSRYCYVLYLQNYWSSTQSFHKSKNVYHT